MLMKFIFFITGLVIGIGIALIIYFLVVKKAIKKFEEKN